MEGGISRCLIKKAAFPMSLTRLGEASVGAAVGNLIAAAI